MFNAFKKFKQKLKHIQQLNEVERYALEEHNRYKALKGSFMYYSTDKLKSELKEFIEDDQLDLSRLRAVEELLIDRGELDHSMAHEALNEMSKILSPNQSNNFVNEFLSFKNEQPPEPKKEYDAEQEFNNILSEFVSEESKDVDYLHIDENHLDEEFYQSEPFFDDENGIIELDLKTRLYNYFLNVFEEVDYADFDLFYNRDWGRLTFKLKPDFSKTKNNESKKYLWQTDLDELHIHFNLVLEDLINKQAFKSELQSFCSKFTDFAYHRGQVEIKVYEIIKESTIRDTTYSNKGYPSKTYIVEIQRIHIITDDEDDLPF
jgi:hypothetical protein